MQRGCAWYLFEQKNNSNNNRTSTTHTLTPPLHHELIAYAVCHFGDGAGSGEGGNGKQQRVNYFFEQLRRTHAPMPPHVSLQHQCRISCEIGLGEAPHEHVPYQYFHQRRNHWLIHWKRLRYAIRTFCMSLQYSCNREALSYGFHCTFTYPINTLLVL